MSRQAIKEEISKIASELHEQHIKLDRLKETLPVEPEDIVDFVEQYFKALDDGDKERAYWAEKQIRIQLGYPEPSYA